MKTYRFMIAGGVVSLIAIFGLAWLKLCHIEPRLKPRPDLVPYHLLVGMPKEKIPPGLWRRIETEFGLKTEDGSSLYDFEHDKIKPYKKELQWITMNDYDKAGNLIKTSYCGIERGAWTEYKYDNKGNMIARRTYNNDKDLLDKWVCKYDDKGRAIEQIFYTYDHYKYGWDDETGTGLIGTAIYKYEGEEKRISQCWWYPPNKKLTGKVIYKYDDKGNMIEWEQISTKAGEHTKKVYKYDKKNNLIEEYYAPSERYSLSLPFSYKYNENGVLTSKTRWYISRTRESGKEKTIKYPFTLFIYEHDFYPEESQKAK